MSRELINFQRLRAKARQLVRKFKKESWQQFTTAINPNTNPSTVWGSIKSICGKPYRRSIKMLKKNDRNITQIPDIAHNFGQPNPNPQITPIISKHIERI